MPKKKNTTAEAAVPASTENNTVKLTIEVSNTLYDQILASIAACGYISTDEWLMEAIMDKV